MKSSFCKSNYKNPNSSFCKRWHLPHVWSGACSKEWLDNTRWISTLQRCLLLLSKSPLWRRPAHVNVSACVSASHSFCRAVKRRTTFGAVKVILGDVCLIWLQGDTDKEANRTWQKKMGKCLFRGQTPLFVHIGFVCLCIGASIFVWVWSFECSTLGNFVPADLSLRALDCPLWILILFWPTDLPF